MDAEIGVRDLADETRYNMLPEVVRALYPKEVYRPLNQLPEHERLALLVSVAQWTFRFVAVHQREHRRAGNRTNWTDLTPVPCSSGAELCSVSFVRPEWRTNVRHADCIFKLLPIR